MNLAALLNQPIELSDLFAEPGFDVSRNPTPEVIESAAVLNQKGKRYR